MTRFVERRKRERDLPAGPAAVPDEPGQDGDAAAEVLVARLENHPGLLHPRVARLEESLVPDGSGAELLAHLLPLLRVDPWLGVPPEPADGEDLPEFALTGALEGAERARLEEALVDLCLKLERRADPKRPSGALEILVRVHRELATSGHFWVAVGAVGLGLPLAWGSLLDGVAEATEAAATTFAPRDREVLRDFADREFARVEENARALGPWLHAAFVSGPVVLGAERMLDAWRIMLNGLDSHVFGGVREL